MVQKRHLNNAPIREAIIDIRVSPSVDFSTLSELGKTLKQRFPRAEDIIQKTFGFEFGAKEFKTSAVEQGPSGVRLTSQDSKNIALLKRDGFTFSRLHPYETWERMKDDAHDIWVKYRDTVRPETVTRTAVRYINVMKLPLPIADLKEYLTAPPEVPAGLPQGVASYFSRIVLPDDKIGSMAVITQALEAPVEHKVPIILDIDTFKEMDAPSSSDSIWESLENLRDFKNRIFFESITERSAELFS